MQWKTFLNSWICEVARRIVGRSMSSNQWCVERCITASVILSSHQMLVIMLMLVDTVENYPSENGAASFITYLVALTP